jgi:hypothetical protein
VSGWEIFTWFNVAVLGAGSVVVFALFLRQLRALLPRRREGRDDPAAE